MGGGVSGGNWTVFVPARLLQMESNHIPARRSRTPRIALAIMAPVARLEKDERVAVACAAATVGTNVTVVPLAVMVVGVGVFVVVRVFICTAVAVVVRSFICMAVSVAVVV
jgi:hypothetical protein